MYLIGCTYNFCVAHQELSKAKHTGYPCTLAMSAGLADHIWSLRKLMSYRVAPAPWVEPKKRGRPKKQVTSPARSAADKRAQSRLQPLLRLREGVLCSITS